MNNLLSKKSEKNNIIITIPEDFSGLNVEKYREEFDNIASKEYETVSLDFEKTEFIDSSGIGAMIFLFKRIEQKGTEMKILDVNGQPKKLMMLLRVNITIPFENK